jgi:hypothetical protein
MRLLVGCRHEVMAQRLKIVFGAASILRLWPLPLWVFNIPRVRYFKTGYKPPKGKRLQMLYMNERYEIRFENMWWPLSPLENKTGRYAYFIPDPSL